MVKINVVGDFCVQNLNNLQFGPQLSDILNSADANIVNFEAPVNCEGAKSIQKSGPSIFQDPLSPEFLHKRGFNIFCLANNHIMDFGDTAYVKTAELFSKLGDATTIGAGTWEDAYKVKYLDIKGVRIGLLNITQHEFGVLDDDSYQNKKLGAAWLLHPIVDELIIEANNSCDFLIVIPHAGQEHFTQPLPEIKTLYRHYIRMGADAVIGGHPHAIQPFEDYKGKKIAYSLGNFVFDKNYGNNPNWYYGLLAQIAISIDKKITMDMVPIKYNIDMRVVEVSNDSYIMSFLNDIDSVYKNELLYNNYIIKECLNQESAYDNLFEASGYYIMTPIKILHKLLRYLKRYILRKPDIIYNKAHMINNLRCEPHRWVLSRIYEKKYNRIHKM